MKCATGGNAVRILVDPVSLDELKDGNVNRSVLGGGVSGHPATINSDGITVTAAIKTAALAALLVLGIVARSESDAEWITQTS